MTDTLAATRGLSPKLLYRIVSVAEACTWTLLILALILRATGVADLVFPAGLTHGFVFVAYGATALLVSHNQRWRPGPTLIAIVSAIVPFATIPVDLWLDRSGRLEGDWRRESGDDPRDQSWIDRLFRWVVNHPLLGLLIALAAITIVVVILLQLGPPTEWFR